MTRSDLKRLAMVLALVAPLAGPLAGCGQKANSTEIVLEGPVDKVQTLIDQEGLLKPPVLSHVEPLDGGRERATMTYAQGVAATKLLRLGKAAANSGVTFNFSSHSNWSSGSGGSAPSSKPAGTTV
jgi:hypothetical protein